MNGSVPILRPSERTPGRRPRRLRRFAHLPDGDLGDVLLYHYPSTWCHFMGDHVLTFRMLPLSPTSTELRTTWLVPADATEGVDYDLTRLTEVWLTTNAPDTALVERTQRGVSSPAYRPGPSSPVEEEGVIAGPPPQRRGDYHLLFHVTCCRVTAFVPSSTRPRDDSWAGDPNGRARGTPH